MKAYYTKAEDMTRQVILTTEFYKLENRSVITDFGFGNFHSIKFLIVRDVWKPWKFFSSHFFDPHLFHFLCSLTLELEQIYSLEAGTSKIILYLILLLLFSFYFLSYPFSFNFTCFNCVFVVVFVC